MFANFFVGGNHPPPEAPYFFFLPVRGIPVEMSLQYCEVLFSQRCTIFHCTKFGYLIALKPRISVRCLRVLQPLYAISIWAFATV